MRYLVAVALLLSFAPYGWCEAPKPIKVPAPIKVMSFNIRYGTAADGENHWDKRREALLANIRAVDPDLLGTQETLKFQRDWLAEKLGQYEWLGVGRDDGQDRGEMMALYIKRERFEKLDGGHFWLSESPDKVGSKAWDAALPRMVTWVKLRDKHTRGSRPILFFNTHFDHQGKQARLESARLLRRKIAELAASCQVIVTGDFNTDEASPPYQALFDPVEGTASLVVDTFRVAHPNRSDEEGTFSGFKAESIRGPRIDWIGASRDWQVVDAAIDRTANAGRTPSDHFAVTATLQSKPAIKVFILAGQSNMEGQAVSDLDGKDYNQGRGTLKFLMNDPALLPMFRHLRDAEGKWTVRSDVWCRYRREHGPLLAGPLSMGFSVYGDSHHFGPELQFGHVVGDHFENQVLLIKTAWGGKSLYQDFRPPSAGGTVGPYYTKMIAEIREALAQVNTDFPRDGVDPKDAPNYELAGLVWYQGWNDGVDPKNAIPQYEENLVHLIRDVRKELASPELPVVIGELTGPWVEAPPSWRELREAQAKAAKRDEWKGTVLFVPTHEFVRKPEDSPNPTHGHHEFGNAETYFRVGDALGKGMVQLLSK